MPKQRKPASMKRCMVFNCNSFNKSDLFWPYLTFAVSALLFVSRHMFYKCCFSFSEDFLCLFSTEMVFYCLDKVCLGSLKKISDSRGFINAICVFIIR
jgi:hypothetical protein